MSVPRSGNDETEYTCRATKFPKQIAAVTSHVYGRGRSRETRDTWLLGVDNNGFALYYDPWDQRILAVAPMAQVDDPIRAPLSFRTVKPDTPPEPSQKQETLYHETGDRLALAEVHMTDAKGCGRGHRELTIWLTEYDGILVSTTDRFRKTIGEQF